jgi:hypothetical protein
MSPDARRFLNYEFASLSLVAALATRNPKAPVYRSGASEDQKTRVKESLRETLGALAEQYRAEMPCEAGHVANISTLASYASGEFGDALYESKFRFGVAQKLLNLYLKYLWVTNYIDEPPHCPIDGRIAEKADLNYQWTSSNSESEYMRAVLLLRSRVAGESIAHWELREFEVGRQ